MYNDELSKLNHVNETLLACENEKRGLIEENLKFKDKLNDLELKYRNKNFELNETLTRLKYKIFFL